MPPEPTDDSGKSLVAATAPREGSFKVTRDAATAPREAFSRVMRDAAFVVIGATCLGSAVNLLRPSGSIPFVQKRPYDIVVPCAEPVGEATATHPDDPRILQNTSLVIDARSRAEFDAFHVPRAINVPFDWLGPPVAEETAEVAQRVARSKARMVIVYGDGDDPDSGREWARLLAGGGIKNVFYVEGGASALKTKGAAPSGDKR